MTIGEIIDELKNVGYSDDEIRNFEIDYDSIDKLEQNICDEAIGSTTTELLVKVVKENALRMALEQLYESHSLPELKDKLKALIEEQK